MPSTAFGTVKAPGRSSASATVIGPLALIGGAPPTSTTLTRNVPTASSSAYVYDSSTLKPSMFDTTRTWAGLNVLVSTAPSPVSTVAMKSAAVAKMLPSLNDSTTTSTRGIPSAGAGTSSEPRASGAS